MNYKIVITHPSSAPSQEILQENIAELTRSGLVCEMLPNNKQQDWPYVSGTTEERCEKLLQALEHSSYILCSRGGYGASDLLPLLPWEQLKSMPHKLIIGCSDIAALHSAIWTRLGWSSLYAAMPGTKNWQSSGQYVLNILQNKTFAGQLSVLPLPNDNKNISSEGWLFGGNFSVLTNLIGTAYFPKSLQGALLFLEDINEHPARLLRYWNQWLQSGVLDGVVALILGQFTQCGEGIADNAPQIYQQFYQRSKIPTYISTEFGHLSPNKPIGIGGHGKIVRQSLSWQL